MRMNRFACLVTVAFGWLFTGVLTFRSEADVIYLGQRAEVTHVWYACRVRDDLQSLKDLSQESLGAAARFAKRHHCKILRPGNTGVVEDYSLWTEDTCLRAKPRADCYWFPEQFVKKAKPPGR